MSLSFLLTFLIVVIINIVDNVQTQQSNNFTTLCTATDDADCRPRTVEYFTSSASRDSDKIVMLTFGSNVHQQLHNSNNSNARRFAICNPDSENLQTYGLTNGVNLLSHVFCRQMGYMTYVGRQAAASTSGEAELGVSPTSIMCNGTEQRLQDCFWPDVRVSSCHNFLEVQCGDCSRYISHIDDGMITTPGFPASFPFTVTCDWLIYTKLGGGIELRFTAFNLPTTQLPISQIGTSSCSASNAFLEITPSIFDEQPRDSKVKPQTNEEKIVANSRRYCVFRIPDRKIKIRSKAVLLHFSSGVHPNLYWGLRPRNFVPRPIGIKVYFRALPQVGPDEIDEEVNMLRIYLVIGAGVISVIVIVASLVIILCLRSHYTAQMRRENSNVNITTWKRVIFCLSVKRQMKKQDVSCLTNNYEELVRPRIPPRSFVSQRSRTLPSRLTESTRLPSTTIRTISQRSSAGLPETGSMSPMNSRRYTQIICSSGHCQYVPVNEIEGNFEEDRRTSVKSDRVSSTYTRSESSV